MAVVAYQIVSVYRDNDQQGWALMWSPLTFTGGIGDSGQPIDPTFAAYVDRGVEVYGTPGSGANLLWEGSASAAFLGLAGGNYWTLNDPFGNALQFTVPGYHAVTEACYTARPRVAGGDSTTSWTVVAMLRRGLR